MKIICLKYLEKKNKIKAKYKKIAKVNGKTNRKLKFANKLAYNLTKQKSCFLLENLPIFVFQMKKKKKNKTIETN